MPIKYIGKTIDFKGKTLWEILGNLKNLGVGRIVARNMHERYPEPSYLKIIKVEAAPNPEISTPDDVRKVHVWVEKTFRGFKYSELIPMFGATYKADFKLIPKDQEAEFCKCDNPRNKIKILPRTTTFPPMLKELIKREMKEKGLVIEEPQLKIVFNKGRDTFHRPANEGETPTSELQKGFGPPITSTL